MNGTQTSVESRMSASGASGMETSLIFCSNFGVVSSQCDTLNEETFCLGKLSRTRFQQQHYDDGLKPLCSHRFDSTAVQSVMQNTTRFFCFTCESPMSRVVAGFAHQVANWSWLLIFSDMSKVADQCLKTRCKVRRLL